MIMRKDYDFVEMTKYSNRAKEDIAKIMVEDPRFGGPITNDYWVDLVGCRFYTIKMCVGVPVHYGEYEVVPQTVPYDRFYNFLCFKKKEYAELFIEEHKDILDYYFMKHDIFKYN